jgi:hypothetical protein
MYWCKEQALDAVGKGTQFSARVVELTAEAYCPAGQSAGNDLQIKEPSGLKPANKGLVISIEAQL